MSAPVVEAFAAAWQAMPREFGLPDAIYAHHATVHALLASDLHVQMTHEGGFDRFGKVPILPDRWAPEGDFFPAWDKMLPVYQRRMLSAARGARIETESIAQVIDALERARHMAPDPKERLMHYAHILEQFAINAVRRPPR